MAANVQSGQPRFTVVKLPVVQLVLETLVLPFGHLAELVKYGWIPFAGSLALRFVEWLMRRYFAFGSWPDLLVSLGHFALFIPFCVTWTRITIDGTRAKLPGSPFAYGGTEWQYAGAEAVMLAAVMVLLGPAFLLYQHGERQFSAGIQFLGGFLFVVGAILFAIAYVRFAFVFPAIAIGRYRGIAPAWRQTIGNLERLGLLIALTIAPYEAVVQILRFAEGDLASGLAAMIAASVQLLMVSMVVVVGCSAPALAYKWIVLGQGRSQAVGSTGRAG